jgi:hypothetical protein
MPGKARVHELAKELGRPSKQVMAKLAELGEFAKSASSTVEAPAVQKIRSYFAGQPKTSSPPNRPTALQPKSAAPTFQAHPRAGVPRRPRRDWYRGQELGDLTTRILEGVVIPRRPPFSSKPGGSSRYFVDEVAEAQALSAEWTEVCLKE